MRWLDVDPTSTLGSRLAFDLESVAGARQIGDHRRWHGDRRVTASRLPLQWGGRASKIVAEKVDLRPRLWRDAAQFERLADLGLPFGIMINSLHS